MSDLRINLEQIEKWRKDIHNRIPIFGKIKRKKAFEAINESRNHLLVVKFLLELLDSEDKAISDNSAEILQNVTYQKAIDLLCELAIRNPESRLAKICVAKGFRPSDLEQRCLFLFVTKQLDAYFEEDPEFTYLRIQYELAEPEIREKIMDVVRSGDVRCQPFAIRPRKTLQECTAKEIKLAIDACIKHRDWERLFTACLELPLKYSLPAFKILTESGWVPAKPEYKNLFDKIASLIRDVKLPEFPPPEYKSKLFEQWLLRGLRLEYRLATETALVMKLETAPPQEGVAIVYALHLKGTKDERVIQAVKNNSHWLVRLAGLVTGLTKDVVTDQRIEPIWWVNELAGLPGVLEFPLSKAAPSELAKLKNAPPSAFEGVIGVARKILQELLIWKVTTGIFEEIVIDATPTSAEFVRVEDDKENLIDASETN